MSTTLAVPRAEATERLARDWYAALDTHEPVATLEAMLDPADLVMVFPEATLTGIDGFRGWYATVTALFFDEAHEVQSVHVREDRGDSLEVAVVVRWEASRWTPPAARSERIRLLASQSWTVTFGAGDRPQIARYTVDRLDYLPGSARL